MKTPSPRLQGGSDTTGGRSKNQGTNTCEPTASAWSTSHDQGNPAEASTRPMACVVAAPLSRSNDISAQPVEGCTAVGTWRCPATMAGLPVPQQAPAVHRWAPLARSSAVTWEPPATNALPPLMIASCDGPPPADAVHRTRRFAALDAVIPDSRLLNPRPSGPKPVCNQHPWVTTASSSNAKTSRSLSRMLVPHSQRPSAPSAVPTASTFTWADPIVPRLRA